MNVIYSAINPLSTDNMKNQSDVFLCFLAVPKKTRYRPPRLP